MRAQLVCRPGIGVVALLLLAGCTLRPPQPAPVVDWATRSAPLAALERWDLRGRIAVKADTGGGQGDLQWHQQGGETRIRVSGPFGAGAYQIQWDERSLSVSSRNGEFSRSWTGQDAAEQFLSEQLGWSFPAVSIRYWLLGLVDPAFPSRPVYGTDGRLSALEQNGWSVTYERYVDIDAVPMPQRIVLQNARARLRLVIDHWDF